MSTTNIKLKRSSVPGKQPNTSILELGEVALNTYDGKIFIKKDDGAESIVTIQEVTEDNLAIDSSLLDNSTASTLAGVLDDLDAAITTSAGGGLSQVTSDSTLTGLGTAGSPLSVVNDGHSHTVSTITNFTSSVNSAIDTRVNKTFVDALDVDADTLDGANGSFYLDYDNFVNTPSIPVSGVDFDPVGTDNSTDVTLAGSYDYLTITGQQITLNQIDATTDVSGLATVATSGSYNDLTDKPTDSDTTYDLVSPGSGVIRLSDSANSNDDITFVGSGATTVSSNATHVTISSTDNNTTYSAGDGIDLTGTTFSHADTSTQASLSVLSGGAVVSDIDLDGFGHVTNLATRTLTTSDIGEGTNLYYTTARANTDIDARVTTSFVNALNVTSAGVQANSVALGTDTTGNYVATISGTANEIEVTGSGSETAVVTVGLPDDVTISANLTVTSSASFASGGVNITPTNGGQVDADRLVASFHLLDNHSALHTGIGLNLASNKVVGWNDQTNSWSTVPDTGLARDSAGVVRVTTGTTGTGDLIANNLTANGNIQFTGNIIRDGNDPVLYRDTSSVARFSSSQSWFRNKIHLGDNPVSGDVNLTFAYQSGSTANTDQTQIASFAAATYSSGKFVIQATDSVSGEVHVTELLIVHDGTTASATEYGTIHTGSSPLATYDVDIDTGNVRVLATAASTNSTTYKVTENLITA